MSDVKWCDAGNHPFATRDTGWQEFVNNRSRDAGGNLVVIHLCGPCFKSSSVMGALEMAKGEPQDEPVKRAHDDDVEHVRGDRFNPEPWRDR